MGLGMISIHEEQLQIFEKGSKAKLINLKSFFKSLARFSRQFRIEESFKLLFPIEVAKIW